MKNIWARTDEEDAAFRGDELRASWLFDQLMAAGVLCKCEDLKEIECDACGDAHLEDVTWITEPPGTGARAYIWCPAAGRIVVERERLEVWRIDFDGLARTISSSLRLAAPHVIVEGRLWLLGSGQFGDRAREVFLARGITWPDGQSLRDQARVNISPCPLILVPNLLPKEEAWKKIGRLTLSLSEFDWFSADSESARHRITAILTEHDRGAISLDRALFCKDDRAVWTLSFHGKTVHVRDLVGMTYIAELLRKPGVAVEAQALAGAIVESTKLTQLPGIPMADETTIKAVRTELNQKKTELAGLTKKDWVRKGNIEEEIPKLERYLAEIGTHKGHARKVAGTAQRSRTSVTNAINRAIDQISERHSDLGRHLKHSIKTGTTPVYAPTELPDWNF